MIVFYWNKVHVFVETPLGVVHNISQQPGGDRLKRFAPEISFLDIQNLFWDSCGKFDLLMD